MPIPIHSTLIGHKGRCFDLKYYFISSHSYLLTASEDGTAKLWQVEKKKVLATFPHNANSEVLRCCLLENRILTAGSDGLINVWGWEGIEKVPTKNQEQDEENISSETVSSLIEEKKIDLSDQLYSNNSNIVTNVQINHQKLNTKPILLYQLKHRDSESQVYVCEPYLCSYSSSILLSGADNQYYIWDLNKIEADLKDTSTEFSLEDIETESSDDGTEIENHSENKKIEIITNEDQNEYACLDYEYAMKNKEYEDKIRRTEEKILELEKKSLKKKKEEPKVRLIEPIMNILIEPCYDDKSSIPFGGKNRNPNEEIFLFDAKWRPNHRFEILLGLSDGSIRLIKIDDFSLKKVENLRNILINTNINEENSDDQNHNEFVSESQNLNLGHTTSVAWDYTGNFCLVSYGKGYIATIDMRIGDCLSLVELHASCCYGANFILNSSLCLSWSSDSNIKIWNPADLIGSSNSENNPIKYSNNFDNNFYLLSCAYDHQFQYLYCGGDLNIKNSFLGSPLYIIDLSK